MKVGPSRAVALPGTLRALLNMHGHIPGAAVQMLETILHRCAEAAPEPWYPKLYAQTVGVSRDSLDQPLEQLRMAGLVRLTDWIQGRGQGYALTSEGARVLETPQLLGELREGRAPAPQMPEASLPRSDDEGMTTWERGEEVREALLNAPNPIVTRALLFANIAVFVYGLILTLQAGLPVEGFLNHPRLDVLMRTGAVSGEAIARGEWWRLLTCCFVHGGLIHLGVNMYSLWAVGPLVEKMWGHTRFLAIYLIAGLAGSCVAMAIRPVTLVGASGALWGIMAALAAWILLNRRFLPPSIYSEWMRQLIIVLVLNVGISIWVPQVSASAHFGGGAAGVLAALFLHLHRYGPRLLRILALIALIATTVAPLGALIYVRAHGEVWQELAPLTPRERVERTFQRRLIPALREACETGESAIRQANPLLNTDPEDRPEKDVEAALENLAGAVQMLVVAEQALLASGALADDALQNKAETLQKYLQALQQRCLQYHVFLQKKVRLGGDTIGPYRELQKKVEDLKDPAHAILR